MAFNGLLNLEGIENMSDDELLSANINESGDVNIPVPGGLSEKPSGQPADVNISVPQKTEITADTYNSALGALQKSLKEAAEFMEILQNATVVQESVEQRQEAFVEDAVCQAILEAYEDGPLFEAVDRSDKKDVKKIARSLRPKIKSALDDKKVYFYTINYFMKALGTVFKSGLGAVSGAITGGDKLGGTVGAVIGGTAGAIVTAVGDWQNEFKVRLWQVLGVVHLEEGNIKDVADDLTEKFKDELGDYKILYVRMNPTLSDAVKLNRGWKNVKNVYYLLVDKKIPKELKEFQDDVASAIKKAGSTDKKDDKKED